MLKAWTCEGQTNQTVRKCVRNLAHVGLHHTDDTMSLINVYYVLLIHFCWRDCRFVLSRSLMIYSPFL